MALGNLLAHRAMSHMGAAWCGRCPQAIQTRTSLAPLQGGGTLKKEPCHKLHSLKRDALNSNKYVGNKINTWFTETRNPETKMTLSAWTEQPVVMWEVSKPSNILWEVDRISCVRPKKRSFKHMGYLRSTKPEGNEHKTLKRIFFVKGALFQGKGAHQHHPRQGRGLLDHPYAPRHPPSAPAMGENHICTWFTKNPRLCLQKNDSQFYLHPQKNRV